MSSQNKKILFLLALIAVSVGVFVSFKLQINSPTLSNLEGDVSPTPSTSQQDQLQKPNVSILDKGRLVIVETGVNSNEFDLYLTEKDSQGLLFMTIPDVYHGHYHPVEIIDENVYVIRRLDYDGYPDEEWSDELWLYSGNNHNAKMLYSNKGIDFRAAPNNSMVAIQLQNGTATSPIYSAIDFVNQEGNSLKKLEIQNVTQELNLDGQDYDIASLLGWSDNSHIFWFTLHTKSSDATQRFMLIALDSTNWDIESYDLTNFPYLHDIDFQPNTGAFIASTHPFHGEQLSYEEFVSNETEVVLYYFDPKTQQRKEISKSIAKKFNPKWLNNDTFYYDDPLNDGGVRVGAVQ